MAYRPRAATNDVNAIDIDWVASVTAGRDWSSLVCDVIEDQEVPLHLFHFATKGNYESLPIIYAHRNGAGSMLVRTKSAKWRLCSFWNEPDQLRPTAHIRDDISDLFPLVSVADNEKLTLLPKSLGERPRRVVFREHICILGSCSPKAEGFYITAPVGDVQTDAYLGKPWENTLVCVELAQRVETMRGSMESRISETQHQAALATLAAAGIRTMRDLPEWATW